MFVQEAHKASGTRMGLGTWVLLIECVEHVCTPDRESLTSHMLLRMESTEKCEAVITHFNGKYIKTPPGVAGESSGTEAGGHWRDVPSVTVQHLLLCSLASTI